MGPSPPLSAGTPDAALRQTPVGQSAPSVISAHTVLCQATGQPVRPRSAVNSALTALSYTSQTLPSVRPRSALGSALTALSYTSQTLSSVRPRSAVSSALTALSYTSQTLPSVRPRSALGSAHTALRQTPANLPRPSGLVSGRRLCTLSSVSSLSPTAADRLQRCTVRRLAEPPDWCGTAARRRSDRAPPLARNRDLRAESDRGLRAESDRDLRAESDRDLRAESDRDLRAESDRDLRAESDRDLIGVKSGICGSHEGQRRLGASRYDYT